MYYTQIRANAVAGSLVNGLDGLTTYTAVSGQTGFPTCLTCVPVDVDPRTLPASQLPARDITFRVGDKTLLEVFGVEPTFVTAGLSGLHIIFD